MPSGHSATVMAMAVMTGYTCGVGSVEFGIAAIIAIVVMHDATGVRREAGKHAVAINEIVETVNNLSESTEEDIHIARLKEFVGHTHRQVMVGAILGFIVAVVFCLIAGIGYCDGVPAILVTGFFN